MKFKNLHTLLNEESWGKYKKRTSLAPAISDRIENIDPTPQKKYSIWILNNFTTTDMEDNLIKKRLDLFQRHENNHKTDINSLDFDGMIKLTNKYHDKDITKNEISKGAEKLVDNEDYTIMQIKSYEASCKYGFGAKWCISMKDDNYYWRDYNRENTFIFILLKNEKYYDDTIEAEGGDAEEYPFESVSKISVQIPNDLDLADNDTVFDFTYWDTQDQPSEPICVSIGEMILASNWEVVKSAVTEYREDDTRNLNKTIKTINKRIDYSIWSQLSPREQEATLKVIEGAITDIESTTVHVDQDKIYIKYKGWYTDDYNWDIFKAAFDNEQFAKEVLEGEWYTDNWVEVDTIKEIVSEDEIEDYNWVKVKSMIMKEYHEEVDMIDLYDLNGEVLEPDDIKGISKETLESLVSPYWTWKSNSDFSLDKVNLSFQAAASRAQDTNTSAVYYNAMTDMINEMFNISIVNHKLISSFEFHEIRDVMQEMQDDGEVSYGDEGEGYDIEYILQGISNSSNASTSLNYLDVYWGSIQDNDGQDIFNEDLSEALNDNA